MNFPPSAITIVRVRIQTVSWNAGRRLIVLLALSLAAVAHARVANAGSNSAVAPGNLLRIRVAGLRNDKGKVRCSLFSPANDFPNDRDKTAITIAAPIAGETSTCEFADIAAGIYAVVVFHDENSDGKFNRNWLGLPKEGYGFSNDAPTRWRAPKFAEASFPFGGGTVEILIHIRY